MYNYSLRLSFTLSSCTACIYHYFFGISPYTLSISCIPLCFQYFFFVIFNPRSIFHNWNFFMSLYFFFFKFQHISFCFFQFSMYWLIVKLTLYFCLLFSFNPYVIKCCLNKYPSPRDCGSRRYWRSTSIVVLSLTVLCWSDPLLFILKSTINRQIIHAMRQITAAKSVSAWFFSLLGKISQKNLNTLTTWQKLSCLETHLAFRVLLKLI